MYGMVSSGLENTSMSVSQIPLKLNKEATSTITVNTRVLDSEYSSNIWIAVAFVSQLIICPHGKIVFCFTTHEDRH